MALCASNLVLHVKRIVYSSVRLGCQYARDYPAVLGAGILLLFLHRLCPSLFMFLLSSSPVFLLTALLLGALLTSGEPCAPVIGEETLGNQQALSRESKAFATECSTEIKVEKSFESQVVCAEERSFDSIVHDTHNDEEKDTSVSTGMVLCAEEFSEFANANVIVETEGQRQSFSVPSNVTLETEDRTNEISENDELQEFRSTNTESYHNEVRNRYQLGEIMSSCWQPVMRQDPCSDSESDISGSSSDASMTDIIPMLDELNPPVNLGSGYPSSTFRDSLNYSSGNDEVESEDGDHGSDKGAGGNKNDENDHGSDVDSSDMENVSNVDSLMEWRREKNILKFELEKKLMDMQAADAVQKMEEASHFRVQVPFISTPRPKLLDLSNGSEETIELPQIPDSAPSVLLPWREPFGIPFDQIVDREKKLQETWTPRSHFPSRQHRKQGNLYLQQSTYLQHHNGVMTEKTDLSRNDACDSWSDSDSEQTGNSGKLFGSLEAHIGEEIKIIGADISGACVLEANCEVAGGKKNANLSDASEEKDSIPAGKIVHTLNKFCI
jgi:hypothetical protein